MAKPRKRDLNTPAPESRAGTRQFAGDTTAASGGRDRIAARAYELYVTRGGEDGRDLDDWLEAERDLAHRGGNQDDRDPDPAA